MRDAAAPRSIKLTAVERREQVVAAAIAIFAERGYRGSSTNEIASRAGISQAYLFRLFGTKRALTTAAIMRCFDDTETVFTRAASGYTGNDALNAIGSAYVTKLRGGAPFLMVQLQVFAACDDAEIRALATGRYRALIALVEALTNCNSSSVRAFLGRGLLINLLVTLDQVNDPAGWAGRLMLGIGGISLKESAT